MPSGKTCARRHRTPVSYKTPLARVSTICYRKTFRRCALSQHHGKAAVPAGELIPTGSAVLPRPVSAAYTRLRVKLFLFFNCRNLILSVTIRPSLDSKRSEAAEVKVPAICCRPPIATPKGTQYPATRKRDPWYLIPKDITLSKHDLSLQRSP